MTRNTYHLLLTASMVLGMLFTACKPKYPVCSQDQDCADQIEVCVSGKCQECRDNTHCEVKYPGAGRVCQSGRCEPKDKCQVDSDCVKMGPNYVCKNQQCKPQCREDKECAEGQRCSGQKCVNSCTNDIECGPGRHCEEGLCLDGPGSAMKISSQCRPMDASSGDLIAMELVPFEFDRSDLTSAARANLEQMAACLKQAPESLTVVVEGHCDDRGTQEYNLALGERRAQTVVAFLRAQGIDTRRLIVRSKGENEPLCSAQTDACWAKNRRVQFIQKRQ